MRGRVISDPTPNPFVDPVATYLHIDNKVNNPDPTDDEYPVVDLARDLGYMLFAARTLIQKNAALSERVLKAEKFAEDAAVTILQKDMDNYELSQRLNDLKKGPHEQS